MNMHRHTPTITAMDSRGLPVLSVAYHRLRADTEAEPRTGRQAYDVAGRLRAQWDARLWADGGEAGEPNQSTVSSLTGQPLRTASVDAGWQLTLHDDAGQMREGWDGRGTHRWTDYDKRLRPQSMSEQMGGSARRCVLRFTYGDTAEAATNRCGRMARSDDSAGSREIPAYALSSGTLAVRQRFLAALTEPDWPEAVVARDALLETDTQGAALEYTTRWRYDAQGSPCQQIDAAGHTRRTWLDVCGQAVQVAFQPAGASSASILVEDIAYDASGRAIAETAGNGVETSSVWSAVDGGLQHRRVVRSDQLLQDVDYTYDPIGNVTRIDDQAQPTKWFNGAQVDPENLYTYDTLSRLVETTGRESVNAGIGPALPDLLLPGNANERRRYTQTYTYDAGGNLRTLQHTASDNTQYTRTMAVAARSNRSLFQPAGKPPPDFATGFDANGNQQWLEGKPMAWDARNQLQRATLVVRPGRPDDEEAYVYGGDGMRRRKVRTTQAQAVAHVDEVRYLPGLELRRNTATGEVREVASIPAGRSTVRWLHWQANGAKPLPSSQWRYAIEDHLGSSTLELDDTADVVSHEGYYPYGGNAWWAARNEVDANYKTIRYSGKERDATGLYYYGFRYYSPWLFRWINPDPAGDIDGLSTYAMVANNPLNTRDTEGLMMSWFQGIVSRQRSEESSGAQPGVPTSRLSVRDQRSTNLHANERPEIGVLKVTGALSPGQGTFNLEGTGKLIRQDRQTGMWIEGEPSVRGTLKYEIIDHSKFHPEDPEYSLDKRSLEVGHVEAHPEGFGLGNALFLHTAKLARENKISYIKVGNAARTPGAVMFYDQLGLAISAASKGQFLDILAASKPAESEPPESRAWEEYRRMESRITEQINVPAQREAETHTILANAFVRLANKGIFDIPDMDPEMDPAHPRARNRVAAPGQIHSV